MKHIFSRDLETRDLKLVFIILTDHICKINTCVNSATLPLLESCYNDERQAPYFDYITIHFKLIKSCNSVRCIIPIGEFDKFNYLM